MKFAGHFGWYSSQEGAYYRNQETQIAGRARRFLRVFGQLLVHFFGFHAYLAEELEQTDQQVVHFRVTVDITRDYFEYFYHRVRYIPRSNRAFQLQLQPNKSTVKMYLYRLGCE